MSCVEDVEWWHALVGRYLSSQPLRLLLKAFRAERERVRHRLSAKGKHMDVRMNSCLDQFCTSHRNSHWRSTVQHQLVSTFPFSLVFDGRDVEAEKMYLKKAHNRFRKIKDKKIANAAAPTEKKRTNNTSSEGRVDSKRSKPSPAPTPTPLTEFLTASKDLLLTQGQWEDLQTKCSEEQITAAIVDLKLAGQLRLPPRLSCTLVDVQQEFAQLQRLDTQIASP